jgi:hypothetical protein
MALVFGLFLLTMGQFFEPWEHTYVHDFYNFYTVVVALVSGAASSWWPLLLPIVVVLPAGDSLAVDRRRGLDAVTITRVGWRRYLGGKWVGTTLLSLTAVAVPLLVAVGTAAVAYPLRLPRFLGWTIPGPNAFRLLPFAERIAGVWANAYAVPFVPHFFWAHPALYVAVAVVMALWATVATAGLSIAAAIWVRPPLLTLAIPVLIYWVANWVFYYTDSPLSPATYGGEYLGMSAAAGGVPSWFAVALYWMVPVAAIGLTLGWMVWRHKEWPVRSVGQ